MMQPYRRTDVKVLVLITEPAGTLLQYNQTLLALCLFLLAARREKTSEARQFFRHQVSKHTFKPGKSFSFLHQK